MASKERRYDLAPEPIKATKFPSVFCTRDEQSAGPALEGHTCNIHSSKRATLAQNPGAKPVFVQSRHCCMQCDGETIAIIRDLLHVHSIRYVHVEQR